MGGLGVLLASIAAVFIKEPKVGANDGVNGKIKRELYEKKLKKNTENVNFLSKVKASAWDVMKAPTSKWITIASMFRKFGDMAISCYIPIFFLKVYPSFKTEYAFLNAIMLTVLGFSSNLLGGIIGDRFEKRNLMTKSLICTGSGVLSIPLIALACAGHGSFWLSIAAMSMYILISGGYNSAAITMIQNTVPSEESGKIISAYSFYTSIAQTLSPIVFGFLASIFKANANPALYGPLITVFVAFGYIISTYFYWRGGISYKKFVLKE